MTLSLIVNGESVDIDDEAATLLTLLREQMGLRSVKDGCSPQGQCGCCTVLVDGAPRVSCVTPVRRVVGRAVTTLEGLPAGDQFRWGDAFCATGASQCGFCTPGIILRLAGLEARRVGDTPADDKAIDQALAAHLCRCTGWNTIAEAFTLATRTDDDSHHRGGASTRYGSDEADSQRDLEAAAARASIESHTSQRVDPAVALGAGGFADDLAPAGALVAVPDTVGGWAVGESLAEARAMAGKVQGRRSTVDAAPPIAVPDGEWDLTLATSWVEPAYLETDASWCLPGGEPFSPLANAGAFGAKCDSIAPGVARRLADEHGRAVRVLFSREDTVRLGPKRPPMAIGINLDGHGIARVARTKGIVEAIESAAPWLRVEEVDVAGPDTSSSLRGAGWVEATVMLAALNARSAHQTRDGDGGVTVFATNGARATARVATDRSLSVSVSCGDPLDEIVLRSYCIGAAHMALSWVTSEGIAVAEDATVQDLTIRSFGIVRAGDMPSVDVIIEKPDEHGDAPGDHGRSAVNGSDAVFAAVAAAVWVDQGCPPQWPTRLPWLVPNSFSQSRTRSPS